MAANRRERDAAASPLRVAPILVTGIVLILLSAGLGWWLFSRGNAAFAIDVWWNSLLASGWSPILGGFSLVMNFLGGGWFAVLVVPIGGAVVLALLRRPWSATYFIAAQAISAGLVQLLKTTFGRARPEEILVHSDYGSYPSGHVAGAATLATVFVILFPRLGVLIIGAAWVLLMAFSRTYLHAHWLSDTLGGALAGAGAALVVAAAFARLLSRELSPQEKSLSL
ncbi:phosphatase PAP2 family protein [Microbacterium sp.]|uniref:phosphatase PAP2 family protein n=1 Tax=Microbacterium sp. TaxID=51671 RepID=UPI003F700317